MNHIYKKGSSTLEFIFCAPLLLIIMFVAMEINERIEQRVNTTIAGGNLAWISKINASGTTGQELAKADILGSKNGAVLGATATLQDSNAVMSYSDTKKRADSYDINATHLRNQQSDNRAKDRARQKIGSSTMDTFSTGLASSVIHIGTIIDAITAPKISWLPNLFLRDLYIEEQRLSWSTSSTGTSNAAIAGIQDLTKLIGSEDNGNLSFASQQEYRLLAHRSNYLRRDPAYHPDGYTNQVLFGMGVGDDTFSDYNEKCFMTFDEKPCREKNGFVDYVKTRHGIIFGVKTFLECDFSNFISLAKSLAFQLALAILEKAITDKLAEIVEKPIENAYKGMTDDFGKLPNMTSDLTGSTNTQIEILSKKIDASVSKAVGAISP